MRSLFLFLLTVADAFASNTQAVGPGINFAYQASAPGPSPSPRAWVRSYDGQLVYTNSDGSQSGMRVFNVVDYGARADATVGSAGELTGGTDNGPALQAAINTANNYYGGAVIYFPPPPTSAGRGYRFTTGVTCAGGTDLTIVGNQTRLYMDVASVPIWLNVTGGFSHFSYRGLQFVGKNDSGGTAQLTVGTSLIATQGPNLVDAEDCQFWGLLGDPAGSVLLYNGPYDWHVRKLLFWGVAAPNTGAAMAFRSVADYDDVQFQDYGFLDGVLYSATPQGILAWIESSDSTGTPGASSNRGISMNNIRMDEGAEWGIWLAQPVTPGNTYPQAQITNVQSFCAIASSARALNANYVDNLIVENLLVNERSPTEPQVSFTHCNNVYAQNINGIVTVGGAKLTVDADVTNGTVELVGGNVDVFTCSAAHCLTRVGGVQKGLAMSGSDNTFTNIDNPSLVHPSITIASGGSGLSLSGCAPVALGGTCTITNTGGGAGDGGAVNFYIQSDSTASTGTDTVSTTTSSTFVDIGVLPTLTLTLPVTHDYYVSADIGELYTSTVGNDNRLQLRILADGTTTCATMDYTLVSAAAQIQMIQPHLEGKCNLTGASHTFALQFASPNNVTNFNVDGVFGGVSFSHRNFLVHTAY